VHDWSAETSAARRRPDVVGRTNRRRCVRSLMLSCPPWRHTQHRRETGAKAPPYAGGLRHSNPQLEVYCASRRACGNAIAFLAPEQCPVPAMRSQS
jgi:hypothetical protein